INGTDISFLREQVRFRPLFDANHNAIINWDGATAIYNGYGVLLYTPPVGQTAGSVGALAAIDTWGTSYQTVVDLSGIRDPSGANNNLAGVLWQYGNTDSLFHRLAAPDYSNYAVAPDGKVNGGAAGELTSSDYAVTAGGTSSAHDGTAITINNITDGSARTISLLTTTAGVVYDSWANHPSDPDFTNHAPNEIYYNASGVATVLNWGNLATAEEDPANGLGQVDTQARFTGSAGEGDHFIGGLNPGVSPSNGFFVLFGQFFDHGLDFIGKGEQGKTIKITLDANDPLYGMIGPDGQPTHSITINRANVQTLDANGDAQYTDHTSPFIDQSQTYGSHEQLTTLLREWVQDPVDGHYKAGMSMFDGHTLQTEWKNAAGVMVNDTLPTLNELRAHVASTGREALTWEDVLDLRNRDASGHVTAGNSGSALILDSNPRFDEQHLHGYHDYNNNGLSDGTEASATAGQVAAVDAAISYLGTQVRSGDTFGMVGGMLTLTLGTDLAAGPSTIPAGTYTGASALMMWVNFSDFSIMAPPSGNIIPQPGTNLHDAVSEILMASVGDHYIAGDGRVNENFGLTSIHHVFHEEHNFQVQNFIGALHRDAISSGDQTNLHNFQIDTGTTNASGDYITGSGAVAWDLDKMFQATKVIVEMEYQHAAVDQYARNVTPNIQEFVGYSPDKDPSITLEYAQSAFRFGHSTLRETIDTIDPAHGLTGKIMGYALRAAFLNPDQYAQTGAAATILGMTHQQMNEVDEFVTPALNQGLLGQPLDLAAINIARGRDLGIPTLNDLRDALGLAKYSSWNDFGNNMQHPSSLVNFIAAYSFNGDAAAMAKAQAIMGLADGSITDGDIAAMGFTSAEAIAFLENDATLGDSTNATDLELAGSMGAFGQIDSWLGGLAEIHQPGGLLGETFDLIFVTQIESLMDGDRFYYLYRLAGQQFAEEVGNGQLKDIVERNTGLTHLNGNIFGYADKYYDFGANREVSNGAAETNTTSNNHKYGNLVDQNGVAVTTGAEASKLGAVAGIGALTRNNADVIVGTNTATGVNNLSNLNQNDGAGVGIYTNSGRSTALDGSIIKLGGVAYVRDTRMEDLGADTGAANLNGGVNLDGTPNSGAESSEVIVGTQWGDMIYAQGGDDTVYGDGGNDIIYGGYGIDRLYGGDGNDTIYGGDNPDLIDGGAGDDFIYAESSGSDINGADQAIGGSGNDFISGGTGIDKLSGGTGDDHIKGDGDTDPFTHGSDGNDWVEGNSGGDILYGDNGDDVLDGGADQDQLFGGLGDDILRPGDATGALTIGSDEVLGNDGVSEELDANGKVIGFDIIDFSDNTVRPNGVFFDLSNQGNPAVAINGIPVQVPTFQIEGVIGSAGNDTLIGGSDHVDAAGNDVADDDWIIGGNGNDTLQGGLGNDVIIGGSLRLDSLIGKYNSTYDHNNNNTGATEADQLQDARYQGASHRVAWDSTIDNSGIIDKVNGQFSLTGTDAYAKHFTELLRSDQFKNTVLGNAGSETATGTGGGNDTLVLTGNIGEYSFQAIHANADGSGAVIGIRVTDHGFVDPLDANNNRAAEGSDVVLGVTNFKFANGTTFTQTQLLPPEVTVNDVAVTEGNSGSQNAQFTISLAHAYFADVTVTYSTSNGTAVAPGDYTALPTTTVTIPAGSTSAVVNVAVNGDTQYEANETFNLNLTAATNAVISDNLGVGTITNNDPVPTLSIADASIIEGNSGTKLITFTVTQSEVSGLDTTVNWGWADNSAWAGLDFVGSWGTVTIPAGSTTATLSLEIIGDTLPELNETFTITLSSPTNATIATGSATGTIIDDDLNLRMNAQAPSNTVLPGVGQFATMSAAPGATFAYQLVGSTAPSGSFSVSTGGAVSRTGAAMQNGETYTLDVLATETSTSATGTETITIKTGTAAGDTLIAATGDTIMYGGLGADTLVSGAGDDSLFGMNGADTASYATAGAGVTVSLNTTAAQNTGGAGTDTLAGMENLIGSGFNDTLSGDSIANTINGGAGNDTLNGNGGNDTLIGGGGDDTFNGGGGTGDVVLYTGSAGDFAISALDVNTLKMQDYGSGAQGTDTSAYAEILQFGATQYTIGIDGAVGGNTIGNAASTTGQALFGRGGTDTLNGGTVSDIINGGTGNDVINAGGGDDYIMQFVSDGGRDVVSGGLGNDTFTLVGTSAPETFNIYTRTAWLALGNSAAALNAGSTIVVALGGTTNANIIAELNGIEEIKMLTSNNAVGALGTGTTTGGSGDTINVVGNFVSTGLAYNTITIDGAGNKVDISQLTSDHRVVLNGDGSSIIGQARPQDMINGVNAAVGVVTTTDTQHLQDQISGTSSVVAVPLNEPTYSGFGGLGGSVSSDPFINDVSGALQNYLAGQSWNNHWASETLIQPGQADGAPFGLMFNQSQLAPTQLFEGQALLGTHFDTSGQTDQTDLGTSFKYHRNFALSINEGVDENHLFTDSSHHMLF
ncbi:MAG: peroxidase family protein, partial [Novosphingobium sp.]|uniref:peroxidase family protein n=1 Tax=Novosphingobium sp. TaxID=1874826 RepID=UPI003C7A0AFD